MRFRPRARSSEHCRGSCTVSRISFLTCCRPPMSSQHMPGICSHTPVTATPTQTQLQQKPTETNHETLGAPMAMAWASCSISKAELRSWLRMVTPLEHRSSSCQPPLDKEQHHQATCVFRGSMCISGVHVCFGETCPCSAGLNMSIVKI